MNKAVKILFSSCYRIHSEEHVWGGPPVLSLDGGEIPTELELDSEHAGTDWQHQWLLEHGQVCYRTWNYWHRACWHRLGTLVTIGTWSGMLQKMSNIVKERGWMYYVNRFWLNDIVWDPGNRKTQMDPTGSGSAILPVKYPSLLLACVCRLFYKQMDGLRKGWIQSSEESFYKKFSPDSAFWFINFFADLGMRWSASS